MSLYYEGSLTAPETPFNYLIDTKEWLDKVLGEPLPYRIHVDSSDAEKLALINQHEDEEYEAVFSEYTYNTETSFDYDFVYYVFKRKDANNDWMWQHDVIVALEDGEDVLFYKQDDLGDNFFNRCVEFMVESLQSDIEIDEEQLQKYSSGYSNLPALYLEQDIIDMARVFDDHTMLALLKVGDKQAWCLITPMLLVS